MEVFLGLVSLWCGLKTEEMGESSRLDRIQWNDRDWMGGFFWTLIDSAVAPYEAIR